MNISRYLYASMEMAFKYATIAYTALFLSMGIVLLTAYIPSDKRLASYRTGRRVFAFAYLLLGVTGITDLIFLPANGVRDYITIFSIATVSLLHAWLNTYAYLLLQEPSQKSRRLLRRYGALWLPLIIAAGFGLIFVPAAHSVASFVIGAVYAGQIVWTIAICRREYRANVRAMENYYDGTLRFSWMNSALNMTLGLALVNLVSFYIPELSLTLRIATTLFYTYFAIRLLNYLHLFVFVEEARTVIEADRPTVVNSSGNSEKLASRVALWCDSKRFCRDSLTRKDVADEIGTNHTYLSVYLNKQLGCSFQQWLNTLRIEESKVLLKEYPQKSIEEIGRMVGIPESYNFSRWFKQVVGISPHQWRKDA